MATAKKNAPSKASPAKKKSAAKKTAHAADQIDEQLARYQSMRDFNVTAEPSGKERSSWKKEGLPFVIQKHAATHLHYDFRLGWNGVLKSWACAKGPSYNPRDRRLAVQVEDHPMEYGGFEGIIPKGQYGGGTVMLWDQGTWEPQAAHPDVDAGLRDGSLKFTMHGTKMKGNWTLVRMNPKPGSRWGNSSKPNWLLIKEHDSFERAEKRQGHHRRGSELGRHGPRHRPDRRQRRPCLELQRQPPTPKGKPGTGRMRRHPRPRRTLSFRAEPEAQRKARPKREGREVKAMGPSVSHPTRQSSPTPLASPCRASFLRSLPTQATEPPTASGWLSELKLDGYRVQAPSGQRQGLTSYPHWPRLDPSNEVPSRRRSPRSRYSLRCSMARSSSSATTATAASPTCRPPFRTASESR